MISVLTAIYDKFTYLVLQLRLIDLFLELNFQEYGVSFIPFERN